MSILHISAYKFVQFKPDELSVLQKELCAKANEHTLKGTILLSEEGINICLAGSLKFIQNFQNYLQNIPKLFPNV